MDSSKYPYLSLVLADAVPKDRKTAVCPNCGPGAYFRRELDLNEETGQWETVWQCGNCYHTKKLGKPKVSPAAQQRALEKIRRAIENSGTPQHPVVIKAWEEKKDEHGVWLTVNANQGGEGNMLAYISSRWLGILITNAGGIKVYSDSKHKSKKDLESVAQQLRDGRLYVW